MNKKEAIARIVAARMLGDQLAGQCAEIITFGSKRFEFRIQSSKIKGEGFLEIAVSPKIGNEFSCGKWIKLENGNVWEVFSVRRSTNTYVTICPVNGTTHH